VRRADGLQIPTRGPAPALDLSTDLWRPDLGNLLVQTHNHAPLTLVVLDWSQAGRLSAPLRHALIILCLYCITGDEPSPEILTRLLESNRKSSSIPISMPGRKPSRMPPECSQAKPLREAGASNSLARPARFLSYRTGHANARGHDAKKTGWAA